MNDLELLARLVRDDVHRRRGDRDVICLCCRQRLALVPDVGWVVDEPTGTYDLCEAHPFGTHEPDA